jgi:hypothetical protein
MGGNARARKREQVKKGTEFAFKTANGFSPRERLRLGRLASCAQGTRPKQQVLVCFPAANEG